MWNRCLCVFFLAALLPAQEFRATVTGRVINPAPQLHRAIPAPWQLLSHRRSCQL